MNARKNIGEIPRRARIAIGLGFVGIASIAMLALTWRTWCEPIVDFGRELYVPWQLSQGKVLYRDIAYFNGPLSPYFNSLVFRIFGPSLMSLVWVNIAILIAILLMMHRLLAIIANEVTATLAVCAFVLLLAIGQPGAVGNYNFITPYSHEMTHGLALSLAAMLALARYVLTRVRQWIALSGAFVGLVFLTKPEIFLAAGFSVALGAIFASKRNRMHIVLFIACATAVPVIAFLLLLPSLSPHAALAGILGGWRFAFDPRLNGLPFYQRVRGTFDLDESLGNLAIMTAGYLVLFGIPAVIGRFVRASRPRSSQCAAGFVVIGALLLLLRKFIHWEEVGVPLILIAAVAAFLARDVVQRTFMLFALLLLAKTALHVRLYHYGFALSAPALLITIASLHCWIPAWVERRGGSGALLRGTALAAIAVACGMYVYHDAINVHRKTTRVGSGANAFYTDARGQTVNRIIALLKTTPPNSTIAVVPQGAMLNFLSGRPDSIPFIVQMPPEVIMFSPERMVQSFDDSPPDYVVYLATDTSEYGVAGYGIDFGRPMFEWISANYRPIVGEPQDPNLGWMLFERQDAKKPR